MPTPEQLADAEYWEQHRALQQAVTDSRRDVEDKVAALNRAAHEARDEATGGVAT